ncbi:MAG: DUF4176 domain-containing protein [Lachnospiraceae bacterium]|nr:DUF4176 domain-containing protein [Lachnospiraceae bacterium]
MNNITKKLLPIGTVVQLVNKKEKIMICGRQQIDLEEQVEYDYLGCVYPKGIDNEDVLLFDADNILMVYFLGYQDLDEIHQRLLIVDELKNGNEDEE